MKIYEIKKLIHQHASIRSYVVLEALRRNESICVKYNNDQMVLTPKDLKDYKQFFPEKIQSKFSGSYELYDYEWKPENQGRLNLFIIK